jgi:proteasome beta subunit
VAFFHHYSGPSFISLIKGEYPELIPDYRHLASKYGGKGEIVATTTAAIKFKGGVLIGSDRRATLEGHYVMNEHVIKVFKTDDYSAIAIAGSFGPAVKMAKLFKTELEHYEKMEGATLSLAGKANRLSLMVEQHLPAALQGLAVVPLFAGYEPGEEQGEIFEYDITGGVFLKTSYEPYSACGSGGERAKGTFEHFYREDLDRDSAVELFLKGMNFAAKKDAATGGKNFLLKCITCTGVEDIDLKGQS